ncbi:MAG: hypothetical protein IJO63_04705 [Bacilli bacterium]|nr:hypothetical protein [Bacilli bacterium]
MKRFVIILCVLLLCGCDFKYKTIDSNELIFDANKETESAVQEPKYEDENPVEISLYVDNAFGGLDIVKDEFRDTWRLKRDIVVFGSLFTSEEIIEEDYFQNMWKNAAEKYDDYFKYKTGWHVYFKLTDGTIYDQMVFKPSDVDRFYDYLEIYLYDSANQPIGVWYSHLTDNQMTEDTVLTSMKLTAGSLYEQIDGEITVTVFTYDSEDDFDESGKYRGNSLSTVKVYNN